MSDDLVYRLRTMAEVGYGTAGEAATEIESLRSRLSSALSDLERWQEMCRLAERQNHASMAERDSYASRLGKIHSLMTKSYDPIPPGAAMGILMATIQEVAELSAGAIETLTVRVSDEELAEINRNAIARGQAPLTPVVERHGNLAGPEYGEAIARTIEVINKTRPSE